MDLSGQTIDEMIQTDLLHAFQAQYGEEWYKHLHKNLKPSPLKSIAEARNVPLYRVKQCRARLMHLGLFFKGVFNEDGTPQEDMTD